MSELIKKGKCTCGCVEQSVRETSDGRMFTTIGGLGYVESDIDGDFSMRIWDEYFENTETFAGERPTEYAVKKSWQNFHFTDAPMPEDVFDKTISNLHDVFIK